MKTFGVLAVATLMLVGIGFGTGAFAPGVNNDASVEVGGVINANDGTAASCSCCSDDQATAAATPECDGSCGSGGACCQDKAANANAKTSCGCDSCETTVSTEQSTVSEKPNCCGSCGSGGACCQDANVSRSNMVVSAQAPEGLVGDVPAASMTTSAETSPQEETATEANSTGDWPMWGGTLGRNMVSDLKGIDLEFDLQEGTRINWVANLGSQTYGNAIVAGGKVFVGCNNGAGYRAEKHPDDQDKGCVLCFDEETGEFLWQLTREKLTIGRVSDWPLQGICSTPAVELAENEEGGSGRMWVVTNRCELMCVDLDGFADGNDGPFEDEVDLEAQDADIIWNLDMIEELGVFPHNLATSSPVVYGDMVYLLTSNGVDEAHLDLPSPRAPCFLAVNKNTGEVVWEANQPFDKVLHGQWASPTIGEVNGKAQVYFPGGDGWLYALDAMTGEEIWKFDLNPKETVWELGGRGTRNAVIATAVFKDNSLVIAVGQDPEHGEGVGHLWRIDATKTGEIISELGEIGQPGEANPNSGVIWHYGGTDDSGTRPKSIFRRTMSTVSIADGLVFAVDLSGYVHCIDYETGARYWEEDLLTGVWGSTMVADNKVFLGSEEGTLFVFEADKSEAKLLKKYDTINNSSIYSTPTIANGKMFLTDRTRLYSIQIQGDGEKKEE